MEMSRFSNQHAGPMKVDSFMSVNTVSFYDSIRKKKDNRIRIDYNVIVIDHLFYLNMPRIFDNQP